jgi:hypothetical protein
MLQNSTPQLSGLCKQERCFPEMSTVVEFPAGQPRATSVDEAIERIEQYGFTCEAGPLEQCQDWHALKDLLKELTVPGPG